MSAGRGTRRRLLACGVLAVLCCTMAAPIAPAPASASGSVVVQYYYLNPCASCDGAGEFRALFRRTVGDTAETQAQLLTYNTFQLHSDEAYRRVCDQLGIPREQRALPMVVIGGKYLIGKAEIESGLRALFLDRRSAATGDIARASLLWDTLIGLLRGILLCAAASLLLAAVGFWPPKSRGTLLPE